MSMVSLEELLSSETMDAYGAEPQILKVVPQYEKALGLEAGKAT